MKTSFYYFIVFLLTFNLSYSQKKSNKLIHIIDSTFHDVDDLAVRKHKVILLHNGKYIELIDESNYEDEFEYVSSYRTKKGDDIFVFESYNTPTGDTELFYVIPQLNTVLFLNIKEYEIPLYTSYNLISQDIQVISFEKGECGEIMDKKLSIYKKIDENKHCKTKLKKSYIIVDTYFISPNSR